IAGLGAGQKLRIGLRAPRAAGRQEARGQTSVPKEHVDDPRDRWIEIEGPLDEVRAELTPPAPWHPSHVVLVAELVGDVAIAGPRRADGKAILGAVKVEPQPTQVVALRTEPLTIDGRLDEAVWAQQGGTPLTQSLDGEPDEAATLPPEPGTLGMLEFARGTRVAFAWDDEHLYAAADVPDEDLWTDYTQQDDPLYKQEAFELFVAATNEGRRYLEYQVSARGVTFDARFPRYRAGDEAWDSRWRTAVRAEGTVNNARDRDRGMTVEVAIPWAELCEETEIACPPRAGMKLRVGAFRLERAGRKRPIALSLSPTRVPDFHAWNNAAVLELL
ncbi:MAG TPA: carbohydrate-binding family 9-like protein, partial [Nannocystis sp.]